MRRRRPGQEAHHDSSYIVIPGVLVSTTLLIVVSLLTRPSPPHKWAPFFAPPGTTLEEAIGEQRGSAGA